jgi:hypothetical protein
MTEIDPKLSRLYREASTEDPPADLDAAILTAARKRIAQRRERALRQKRSLWSRWMAPAGVVATLVLGVSIALLVAREQPGKSNDPAMRNIPARPQSWPPVPGSESVKPEAAAPARAPESTAPTQAPEAAAQAQAPGPIAPAPAPAPGLPAPATATESNVARDSASGGLGAAAPGAPAEASKLAPMPPQAAQRSPEAWLEEIKRLKRDGHEKDATEQLAEFRKTYPVYRLPENLRELQ